MTEAELRRVALDNIRNNQISIDGREGVSVEVAEDLGFTVDPTDISRIVQQEYERIAKKGLADARAAIEAANRRRDGDE